MHAEVRGGVSHPQRSVRTSQGHAQGRSSSMPSHTAHVLSQQGIRLSTATNGSHIRSRCTSFQATMSRLGRQLVPSTLCHCKRLVRGMPICLVHLAARCNSHGMRFAVSHLACSSCSRSSGLVYLVNVDMLLGHSQWSPLSRLRAAHILLIVIMLTSFGGKVALPSLKQHKRRSCCCAMTSVTGFASQLWRSGCLTPASHSAMIPFPAGLEDRHILMQASLRKIFLPASEKGIRWTSI